MARWDWQALELLREWNKRPLTHDMSLGAPVYHRPTERWLSFGELIGEELIAIDSQGEPQVIPSIECSRGWNADTDPDAFRVELSQRKERYSRSMTCRPRSS